MSLEEENGWYITRNRFSIWVEGPDDSWRLTMDHNGCIEVRSDCSHVEIKMPPEISREFIELAYERVSRESCWCR